MTLHSAATRPRPNSREHELLASLRSGGFGVRYNEDDAVHRIMAPTARGNTTVGLIVIRNYAIAYAEFDRTVYPWWGRPADTAIYDEAFANLESDVTEGRRK